MILLTLHVFHRIFPDKNHLCWGFPPFTETPPYHSRRRAEVASRTALSEWMRYSAPELRQAWWNWGRWLGMATAWCFNGRDTTGH